MIISKDILTHISPDYVRFKENEQIEILEVNEGGAGKATFALATGALFITHHSDKPPLRWAKNQKCADGAIVVEVDGKVVLHVVELKKTVNQAKWIDIKAQLEGMIHNAVAILSVIGLENPAEVIFHLAYEVEKISVENSANSIYLKVPTGKNHTIGASLEWERGRVDLSTIKGIALRKIVRNPSTSIGTGNL